MRYMGLTHTNCYHLYHKGSFVQNAIVDQNVRIGRNVRIVNQQKRENYDGSDFTIRNGITVIHKNAALPDDTVV